MSKHSTEPRPGSTNRRTFLRAAILTGASLAAFGGYEAFSDSVANRRVETLRAIKEMYNGRITVGGGVHIRTSPAVLNNPDVEGNNSESQVPADTKLVLTRPLICKGADGLNYLGFIPEALPGDQTAQTPVPITELSEQEYADRLRFIAVDTILAGESDGSIAEMSEGPIAVTSVTFIGDAQNTFQTIQNITRRQHNDIRAGGLPDPTTGSFVIVE